MAIRDRGNGSHGPPSGNGSPRHSSNGGNGSSGGIAAQIRGIALELRAFRADQARFNEEQARLWTEQQRRWEEQRDVNVTVLESLRGIIGHVNSLHHVFEASQSQQRKINRVLVRNVQALRRTRK